jgi:transcriptional regulator with XRE-family HTH domain
MVATGRSGSEEAGSTGTGGAVTGAVAEAGTVVDAVADAVAEAVAAIGPRLRRLRLERGLSLQQVAVRSGVSAAAIHKIEHNGMVPTITTLLKLAAFFDRPVGWFTGVDAGGPELALDAAAATVEAGGAGVVRPPGEHLVVVVEGALCGEVDGREHRLRAGESLHYRAGRPHCWTNPGPGPARAVWVRPRGR